MFTKATPIIIKAITPIHAGTGRQLGTIDMPIQKEHHTGIPKIESSTIKGPLKEMYRNKEKDKVDKLFGSEEGNETASLLGFTDAKLIFYPIISVNTIFSYITCPYLLSRYFEDLELCANEDASEVIKIDETKVNEIEELKSLLMEGECILLKKNTEFEKISEMKKVILDEYSFINNVNKDQYEAILKKLNLEQFNLKEGKDVVIISDEDFIEIISLCREVITRNKIDQSAGRVLKGQLFTEEYLSTESILYTLMLKNNIKDDEELYDAYIKDIPKVAQIGGNATIGKGIVKMYKVNLTNEKTNK